MKFRKTSIWFYLAAAVACIYSCTGFFKTDNKLSEYDNSIQQIKYQLSYNDVYFSSPNKENTIESTTELDNDKNDKKVVYLTFDDGPSARTAEILDILDEYNIKATFFIVCSDKESNKELLKRAHDSGHTIGVHSACHEYKTIYKSVDNFLSDFEVCFNYIKDITGESPSLFRFPGGSINNFNKKIAHEIIDEMTRRGFKYFDWNVCSDDATRSYNEESIYNKVVNGCKGRSSSVVLMHDSATKKETVAALKRIIPDLLEQGYVFEKLDENVKPIVFNIK